MVISVLKYTIRLVSNEDVQPRQYVEKLFSDLRFAKATQTTKVSREKAIVRSLSLVTYLMATKLTYASRLTGTGSRDDWPLGSAVPDRRGEVVSPATRLD